LEAGLLDILLKMGLPGVVIVGLAFALRTLYQELTELHTTRAAELKELHGKTGEVIGRNTAALDRHGESMQKILEKANRRPGRES